MIRPPRRLIKPGLSDLGAGVPALPVSRGLRLRFASAGAAEAVPVAPVAFGAVAIGIYFFDVRPQIKRIVGGSYDW